MKLTNFIVITFYTLTFLAAGSFLIHCSLGIIPLAEVLKTIEDFYEASVLNRALIGLVGILFVVISVLFVVHLLGGLFRRERSVVFTTAGGQIRASLSAIEDVVQRCGSQFFDVKEMRPRVSIRRWGLDITSRVTLYEDANVPETTRHLESLIKDRLRSVLGIEEEIRVAILVTKVVARSSRELRREGPSRKMEFGR